MVGLKQEFRQSQNLVMTQQLQQSIKLLQLSAVELQEYIDTELEKNPLLSRDEGEEAPAADDAPEVAASEESEIAAADTQEITVSEDDYSVNESLNDGS